MTNVHHAKKVATRPVQSENNEGRGLQIACGKAKERMMSALYEGWAFMRGDGEAHP